MASYRDSAGNLKGTNIPYDSINASKRDQIGSAIVSNIAQENWRAANDKLFEAAYWSDVGREEGQGQGNPAVGAVQVGDYMVNGSPHPWAAYAIKSQTSVYNTNFGVYSWDEKLGVLKDGKSIGYWGGQAHTEQSPHFIDDDKDVEGAQTGSDPAEVGKIGKPPVNPVVTGGGDEVLRTLWPLVDWGGGGGNAGDMDQYDWWESQGYVDTGSKDYGFPKVDPQILKPGDFGFSKDVPEATSMYPQFNYLNQAGIGTNLAYAPGSRTAWAGRETAADRAAILAAGGTPTYYSGMTGGGG